MAAFLTFILLFFLTVLFIGGLFAWRVFRQLRSAAEKLREQAGFGSRQASPQGYQNKDGIIDTRSEEEARKKIFAQDEGEYVEFTEE